MYAVDTIKSVILTTAASERIISVEEAVALSRLEEEFQVYEIIFSFIRVKKKTSIHFTDIFLGQCGMVS